MERRLAYVVLAGVLATCVACTSSGPSSEGDRTDGAASRGSESVSSTAGLVPNVIGLRQRDAIAQITNAGLRVGSVTVAGRSASANEMNVCLTDPAAGTPGASEVELTVALECP